jgi:ankyrin repeat protein
MAETDLDTAVIEAIEDNDLAKVKVLHARGADLVKPRRYKNQYGVFPRTTPLHRAAGAFPPRPEIVRYLLENGAKVGARDFEKATPLHGAAYTGNAEIVGQLIDAGAGLDVPSSQADTPLVLALMNGSIDAVRRLLDAGADPNKGNRQGNTLLHGNFARRNDAHFSEVLALGLTAGGDVNAKNEFGATPLHEAARSGSASWVRLLLSRGADPNLKDKKGRLPIDQATTPEAREALSGGAAPAAQAAPAGNTKPTPKP